MITDYFNLNFWSYFHNNINSLLSCLVQVCSYTLEFSQNFKVTMFCTCRTCLVLFDILCFKMRLELVLNINIEYLLWKLKIYVKNKFQSHYIQLHHVFNLIFDSVFILFTLNRRYCLTLIFCTTPTHVFLFEKNCPIACYKIQLINLKFQGE